MSSGRGAGACGGGSVDGGYDHEFFDDVPAKYICSICTKVLRDARLTVCCGQHFCNFCLTTWLNQGPLQTCPHCRAVGFENVFNKEKIREINELRVYCTQRRKGCKWVGQLGSLEDHLQSDRGCGYVTVTCYLTAYRRNGNIQKNFTLSLPLTIRVVCGVAVERRHLAAHKEMCKYREYTCQYCGYDNIYDAIAGSGQSSQTFIWRQGKGNHYQNCDRFPLECVNKCGEVDIQRGNMSRHQEKCPLEPLDCPFKYAGCADPIPRKGMHRHCQDSMQDHLLLLAKSHEQLARKNEELSLMVEGLAKNVFF